MAEPLLALRPSGAFAGGPAQPRAAAGAAASVSAGRQPPKNQRVQSGFRSLPAELLAMVFCACDFRTCGRLETASRDVRALVQERSLWRTLYLRRWALSHRDVRLVQQVTWRGVLVQKELVMENFARGLCVETVLACPSRPARVAVLQQTVVAAGYDHRLRAWDASGEPVDGADGVGHRGFVRCLQADPFKVVTGASDRDVRVWSAGSLECRATLSEHDGPISALQFHDALLATGSMDSTAKLWDLVAGASLLTLQPGHGGPVVCLRLLPQRRLLLTGGHDRAVRAWDTRSLAPVAALDAGAGAGAGVVEFVAEAGEQLVLTRGRGDPVVRVWDLRRAGLVHELAGPPAGPVTAVRVLDGARALTGHRDGSVRLWDAAGSGVGVAVGSGGGVSPVLALAADDKKVVAGGADGVVRTWALDGGVHAGQRAVDGPVKACEIRGGQVVAATAGSVRMMDFAVVRGRSGWGRGWGTRCSCLF